MNGAGLPVHVEHCLPPRKDNIWAAVKTSDIQTESQSRGVKRGPDQHLGLGVLSSDGGHHPATRSLIDDVYHNIRPRSFVSRELWLPKR